MSCLTKIRAAMDTMTASELKLANLIIDDPKLVIGTSAKVISERCGTSPASVIRFARMLGFSSLQDMKDDLRMDMIQMTSKNQQIDIDFDAALIDLAPHICSKIVSGMETTLNIQNFDIFQRAVDIIAKASTVYLYGIGASSLPALDMLQKLVRVNKHAIYRYDHDLGILDSLYMTKSDAVIAFSYSGRTKEVNIAVRNASKRGVPCIAVTKFGRSPLSSFASITLPLPENEMEVRHAAVQSKYASLLLVDLLFIGYVQHHKSDIFGQLETTRAMIRQMKEKAE